MTQSLFPYTTSPASLSWVDQTGTANALFFDLVVSEEWEQGAEVTEHPVEQGANVADHVRVALPVVSLELFATNEPLGPKFDPSGLVTVGSAQVNNFVTAQLEGLPLSAKVWVSNIGLRGLVQGVAGGLGGAGAGIGGNVVGGLLGAAAASLIPPGQAVDTPLVATAWVLSDVSDFVAQTIALLTELKDTAQLITVNGSKQTTENMVIETFTYRRSEDEGTGAAITLGLKQIRVVQTQTVSPPLPAIPRATPPVNAGLKPATPGTPQQQQSWLSGIAGWAGLGNSPHP